MDIPIVINNFNRLTTTKRLADDLANLGYTNVHILDNNSTYLPLLEWYKECPYIVKRLSENMNFLSIYNSGYINEWLGKRDWIVYSDSDIELNPATPTNFVDILIEKAELYNKTKAGLALRIDDLPNNLYSDHFRNWERKFWEKEIEKDVYDAQIDTTFCIIKPGLAFDYNALRIGGNMTAKHVPWYTDFNNLDEEERHYLEKSIDSSSYKRFYTNQLNK